MRAVCVQSKRRTNRKGAHGREEVPGDLGALAARGCSHYKRPSADKNKVQLPNLRSRRPRRTSRKDPPSADDGHSKGVARFRERKNDRTASVFMGICLSYWVQSTSCSPPSPSRRKGREPRVIVTDKLRSYGAAKRTVLPHVIHRQSRYLNNPAENSHQPTRQRERRMKRFKSPEQAQRFPLTSEPSDTESQLPAIAT
jgi:DDE domain